MYRNVDKTLQVTRDLSKFKGPLKSFETQGVREIKFTNRLDRQKTGDQNSSGELKTIKRD